MKAFCGIIFALVLIWIVCGFDISRCKARGKKMGYESSWGPLTGCMIKVQGDWIAIDLNRTGMFHD